MSGNSISTDILNRNLNSEISYEQFFRALGYSDSDTVYLRTFNDKNKSGSGENKEILLSRFSAIVPHLREQNSRDRGIFFVVNGGGQSDKAVKHARAQFNDFDDYPFEEQIRRLNEFPLEPSIIIKTKKSLHSYWILENGEIKLFRELQQRLIQYFGSDPVIKNESRVMRLYGFEHRKTDIPVMVTLVKFDPELRYTQRQLHEVLPLLKTAPSKPGLHSESSEGEKIPVGQRHYYVVKKIGEFLSRLKDSADDQAILALVEADFLSRCEDADKVDIEDFRKKYLETITKLRARHKEEDSDPKFYSFALRAWKDEHPGETFDKNKVSWAEVRAAGERAQDAFKEMEADFVNTVPSKEKHLEQPEEPKTAPRYEPEDYTDVGQARALYQVYGGKLRFSRATKWLVYDGKRWEESEERARSIVHKFTDIQLKEARKMLKVARAKLDAAIESDDDEAKKAAQEEVKKASGYRSHILSYRKAFRISATLTELAPSVLIDVKELDKNPYLLNTPSGTVDLKTGDIHPHDPGDYCTKITACGPSGEGAEEWARFLEQLTSNDAELKEYLQMCFGMAAIGAAMDEKLLIAYGSGGNGKSTCCNAVYTVLGDYSGNLSAEALTVQKMKNIDPELAELRGKRLILAAELQEGQRLNTSVVKKICSTDMIQAAKKFKDYFAFRPSHTVILFTNYLPKIGSNDRGTLDRLVVLPFKGRFRDTKEEIKNYGQVLAERCGGAILTWVIQGAKKYIEARCRLPEAKAVKEATAEYTHSADWLAPFLEEMCEEDIHYSQAAGALYQAYRRYCERTGEGYIRSAADFRAEMEKAGFFWRKTAHGAMYHGVRLFQEETWVDARRNSLFD